MGAVTFSLDERLVEVLQKNLSLDVFVETGTFKGDTVAAVQQYFKQIYSVELSNEYYQQAKDRFQHLAHVTMMHGDAPAAITSVMDRIKDKSVVYWLDAHWCVADCTAGETSQCPLLAELAAIPSLNSDSVIIIDDARLFLTTPPAPHESSDWPKFSEIIHSLMKLSNQHKLMVLNDCILFFPEKIQVAIEKFAYEHGVNWLNVLDKSRDYDKLLKQLIEKDQEIIKLNNMCHERDEKIKKLKRAVNVLRVFSPLAIAKFLLRPKLGTLYQYDKAKPVKIPKHYFENQAQDVSQTISIVTPAYSHGKFIERTITSVLDQRYPHLEYIVQDGGSSDNTVEILERHASALKHWESKKDNGQSNALNLGFKHATGEIMAYLNSDDVLLPGALHYVADYFAKNPDVDVVYGHRVLIDEYDNEIGRWVLPPHTDEVLRWADYIPQETMFWRRSLWDKVGGNIDESFHFAMDWDLILRFKDAGAKFARLPRFIAAFRVHANQKTSNAINEVGIKEMERLRVRCHGRAVSPTEVKLKTRMYLLKHSICHRLYRVGLLRY